MDWQTIVVIFVLVAASLHLGRRAWRFARSGGGCGGGCGCASRRVRTERLGVRHELINLNITTSGDAPEQRYRRRE